jgi:hypothetical protein
MDPRKPLNGDNTIPQCQICNKIAKNNWIFDCYGRVSKITVDGLLSLHSRKQKQEFLEGLITDLS